MTLIDKFSSFYTDLSSMQIAHLREIYSPQVVFIDPIASHNGLPAVEQYFGKLLKNAKFCEFDIHSKLKNDESGYTVDWTMRYTSTRINKGKPVSVDGVTILQTENGKIIRHRDYYDLGQMVYEHIPIMGGMLRKIKRGLA